MAENRENCIMKQPNSKLNETKQNVNLCNRVNYFRIPQSTNLPYYDIPKPLKLALRSNYGDKKISLVGDTKSFVKIIDELKSIKSLEEHNYLILLKLILYIEEFENQMQRTVYVLKEQKVTQLPSNKNLFQFNMSEFATDINAIKFIEAMQVELALVDKRNTVYIFNVVNIKKENVIVGRASKRFCTDFLDKDVSKMSFKVRFQFQNYPIRCAHYALHLINNFQITKSFFPKIKPVFNNPTELLSWFNKKIEENPEQRQAVLNIASKSSYPAPYILYGPPGTGKTATLVEAICQVWQNDPTNRILICTPSNTAADEITLRLLKYIPENNNIFRMYSKSYEWSIVPEAILPCSNIVKDEVLVLPNQIMETKKIIITTLCNCCRLLFFGFSAKHFSYVFIDEAGQATEPESLIPYGLLSTLGDERIHAQVVLSGDPQQLGPVIKSKLAEPLLGKSMLERLMSFEPYKKNKNHVYNANYITKLVQNYRSHKSIIKISSDLFYEGELKACAGIEAKRAEQWPGLEASGFPIIFHSVSGKEDKNSGSTSTWNLEEIKVILHYLEKLVGKKLGDRILKQTDIGIVTPFALQKQKLKTFLEIRQWGDIEVGTVELFQGREKDVILVSTVRTKVFIHKDQLHIGFLSNPKRFNVAMTRAKSLLIIAGDPLTLQVNKYWHQLIKYCFDNNAIRGLTDEQEYVRNNLYRDIQLNPKKLDGEINEKLKIPSSSPKKIDYRKVQIDSDVLSISSSDSCKSRFDLSLDTGSQHSIESQESLDSDLSRLSDFMTEFKLLSL